MKRFAIAIAAVLAVCTTAYGQFFPFPGPGRASGGCVDSDATAWSAAVVTAGGTVSGTQQTRVCTLIASLKAHSLWTIQDRIWLHAAENAQQATIDIVNRSSLTNHGTTLSAGGWTGDGVTTYIDSGFSSGSNYAQNSATISSYIVNSRLDNLPGIAIGYYDAASTGTQSAIAPRTFGQITYDVNNAGFSNQPSNTDTQGFWTATRTGASAVALYKNSNSTPFNSATTASMTLPTGLNFYILARNQNGTPTTFDADTVAITTIGAGMSAANTAQFQTDLNCYMQNLGQNVYSSSC